MRRNSVPAKKSGLPIKIASGMAPAYRPVQGTSPSFVPSQWLSKVAQPVYKHISGRSTGSVLVPPRTSVAFNTPTITPAALTVNLTATRRNAAVRPGSPLPSYGSLRPIKFISRTSGSTSLPPGAYGPGIKTQVKA